MALDNLSHNGNVLVVIVGSVALSSDQPCWDAYTLELVFRIVADLSVRNICSVVEYHAYDT